MVFDITQHYHESAGIFFLLSLCARMYLRISFKCQLQRPYFIFYPFQSLIESMFVMHLTSKQKCPRTIKAHVTSRTATASCISARIHLESFWQTRNIFNSRRIMYKSSKDGIKMLCMNNTASNGSRRSSKQFFGFVILLKKHRISCVHFLLSEFFSHTN